MSRPRNVGTNGEKLNTQVLGRLMSYILKRYKFRYAIVLICIIISSLASVASSVFMKTLIDGYDDSKRQSGFYAAVSGVKHDGVHLHGRRSDKADFPESSDCHFSGHDEQSAQRSVQQYGEAADSIL